MRSGSELCACPRVTCIRREDLPRLGSHPYCGPRPDMTTSHFITYKSDQALQNISSKSTVGLRNCVLCERAHADCNCGPYASYSTAVTGVLSWTSSPSRRISMTELIPCGRRASPPSTSRSLSNHLGTDREKVDVKTYGLRTLAEASSSDEGAADPVIWCRIHMSRRPCR
jgi:hypothetical protein